MQHRKSIIVYYGDTNTIDNQFNIASVQEEYAEIFVVQEYHKDEVPGEYYDNPEEYYRLKFKQRGYEVKLQTFEA